MLKMGRLQILVSLLTLAALLASRAVLHAQTPAEQEPQVVRIAVTEKGFDAKALQVKLEQGRPVELKFEYNQTINDAHIFELEGYKLQSEEINPQRREVSIKFVPTQTGTVVFYCTVICEIHHTLQDGRLQVVPPGGSGGQTAVETPTSLTVSSLQQASAGEAVTVWATLRDAGGKPIPGAKVSFYVGTQLFPDQPMAAGSATTDAQGQAKFVYTPRADGPLTVLAKFEGGDIYKTSEANYALQVSNAQPAFVEEPHGLAIGRWGPPGVFAVLLVVWSTYAFVVYQIIRIARSKGKAT